MAMYLVSDEELNTIIRLRRRDVTRLVAELVQDHPDAPLADVLGATDQFFGAQVVPYDYLSNYLAEELAYGTPEPEADTAQEVDTEPEPSVMPEVEVEPAPEPKGPTEVDLGPDAVAPVDDDLDGAAIVEVNEVTENVDPLTDPDVDANFTTVVEDDVVQVVDDTYQAEPAADELVPEPPSPTVATSPDEATPAAAPAPTEPPSAEVARRDERANRISLRALQRELRQIDKV